MQKSADAKSPFLAVLQKTSEILIAIGTPPLFAIKILLWTIAWFAGFVLTATDKIFALLTGLTDTVSWFFKIIFIGAKKAAVRTKQGLTNTSTDWVKTLLNTWQRQKSLGLKAELFAHSQIGKILRLPTTKPRGPSAIITKVSLPETKITNGHPSLPQKILYAITGATLCFLFLFIPYWAYSKISQLPDPKLLAVRDIPISTKIYDRNGTLLYQFYADENRTWVKLDSLPKYVPQATIAIEDRSFYHHIGFDPQGIVRAALANSISDEVQGGSTITQQLVKSALLTPAQTMTRKIKEIVLAVWTERLYSKNQILEMYLNQVPYGGAAYGIEAAAQTYFGKKARALTLSEAAFLAGLPSAPTTYSPFGAHPELSVKRQHQVLQNMVAQGYISKFTADSAQNEPLQFVPQETGIKAPHFVMYVKDYLIKKYGSRLVERGGLDVITSLDYPTYQMATKIVRDGLESQRNLHVGNAAVLVTNPKTGEVLAMIGSRDFFDLKNDGNVNVTLAERSPGSAIKPLNYALAFEKGLITPATIIDDSPITYTPRGSPPYHPTNYDNHFHGKVTARIALASSYNVPAVKVLERNGLKSFIDFATKMGITTFTDPSRYGLSLTVGGGEVTMVDIAVAFGSFANGGYKTTLKPVLTVKDYKGTLLEDNTSNTSSELVVSPETAFLISSILADDSARIPTFGPGNNLNIPGHTVSVKTGTTETKRDNWTIGYNFGPNPSLVAVWVGNNDNTPMSPYLESGNTGAAAIWNPIMAQLLAREPNYDIPQPKGTIAVSVCTLGGLLTCDNCPSTKTEFFKKGTEPKQACNYTKEEVDKLLHPVDNKGNKQ